MPTALKPKDITASRVQCEKLGLDGTESKEASTKKREMMGILNWLSAIYGDGHKIITENPVLVLMWSVLLFLGGFIPRKWLLEKLRQVWPWDQVPLSVASSYMLGCIEGGLVSGLARREKTPAEMQTMMAYYVTSHSKVTALMPPAPQRVTINPEEFKRGGFKDGGDKFYYYGSDLPQYDELAVRRWRLWRAVREIKRNEASIFPKKNSSPWER